MSEAKKDNAFKTLGDHLKHLREKNRETLVEVAGAVEIEPDILLTFEQGTMRPSEDILLLLFNHFNIQDEEATKLWGLAKYEQQATTDQQALLANPTVYTDQVHIMVNDYGVVMNFMQTGPNNQPVAVSRIGMSHEHAKSVLEILQKTLNMHRQQQSLPTKNNQEKTD